MSRIIREAGEASGGNFEKAQNITDATVRAGRFAISISDHPGERVLAPYTRRPLNPGDPASSSGTLIDMSELAGDVLAAIAADGGASFDVDDIITTIAGDVVVSVAGNVVVKL